MSLARHLVAAATLTVLATQQLCEPMDGCENTIQEWIFVSHELQLLLTSRDFTSKRMMGHTCFMLVPRE